MMKRRFQLNINNIGIGHLIRDKISLFTSKINFEKAI